MSKKKILLTGGTGFIGRNILSRLTRFFAVEAPPRAELNLLDAQAVAAFLGKNQYDLVIHAANATPTKNPQDLPDRLLSDSLHAYFNLRRCSSLFGRMFYLGSGAEYDKRLDIALIKEEDFGRSLPVDDYGLAKFLMNEDARQSSNVYNLRIFGCYGPTDAKSKFIRDAIDCCLEGRAVTIRQDCLFDYMYVEDLARVIVSMYNRELCYHDYNICTGRRVALSEIAQEVARQMGNSLPAEIAKPGWNREYTASNGRFMAEFPGFEFTSIEEGIGRQIIWQKGYKE